MKVYIASAFRLERRVEEVTEAIEGAGHEVLVKWGRFLHENPRSDDAVSDLRDKKADNENPSGFYEDPVCEAIYLRDTKGVLDCDTFLLVAGDEPTAFNGANVEYGLALAFGKPCFSIGRLDNSALYWPMRRLRTVADFLREIGRPKP